MTIWFTADLHFDHKNIIEYCGRPFAGPKSMNHSLISNWNKKVGVEDEVFILGDFTLRGGEEAGLLFAQLFGKIYVVPGGHDYKWINESYAYDYRSKRGKKVVILPPLYTLEVPQHNQDYPLIIALCHYPMLSWDRSHYGSLHLHGHTHNTLPVQGQSADVQLSSKNKGGKNGRRMDVGVDAHNFAPVSLEEIIK